MENIDYKGLFPNWDMLTAEQQQLLLDSCYEKKYNKGQQVHGGNESCLGMLVVKSGLLRAYIVSENGKEITLYRLFPGDICLLSASCVLRNISFEIFIEASKDSEICIIPTDTFQQLSESSIVFSNYITELMAARFSDVMWILEQTLFTRFDNEISFVLIENQYRTVKTLSITHGEIAMHIGSARKLLPCSNTSHREGIVRAFRGKIHILDMLGSMV